MSTERRGEPEGSCRMNWRIIFSTFVVVFLAELGDKTQLSTMMLASSKKAPVSVFLGSAIALVLSSLIGVLVGDTICRVVSPAVIRFLAGAGFVVVGALILFGRV